MSNQKMFNIKLSVGIASEYEPNLFNFMQSMLEDVGTVDGRAPTPKSVAEILFQIARIDSCDDLEAGLYEISMDARNNMNPTCEKYCLNIIKEIRKIMKNRYK
tara:strand:+ start:185 stop:493 length:309 start_codon:yes stop_codon:yes gene_type:complete